VGVWGGLYIEKLILGVTVFIVRKWGRQMREELILNITLYSFEGLGRDKERN